MKYSLDEDSESIEILTDLRGKSLLSMKQPLLARIGKKRFKSKLIYCLHFPIQPPDQRLDKS
jgi:hypothetical protein